MILGKFLLSSLLVSTTFGIMAYVLLASSLEAPNDFMQRFGVLYLALLPYFLGALINKEGYWHRSETLAELLSPPEEKKRVFSPFVRIVLVVGFYGASIFLYQALGAAKLKELLLLLLGAVWGGTIVRAWFIYQEGLTFASRRTQ